MTRTDRLDALQFIARVAVFGCPFRRRIINGGETWVPLDDAKRAVVRALEGPVAGAEG
jgi:hypothetical protein